MAVDTQRLVESVNHELQLTERDGVASAWLIGSAVSSWREFTQSSDVDVLIVFTSQEAREQFPVQSGDTAVTVYTETGEQMGAAPVDIISYLPGEWNPELESQKARIA